MKWSLYLILDTNNYIYIYLTSMQWSSLPGQNVLETVDWMPNRTRGERQWQARGTRFGSPSCRRPSARLIQRQIPDGTEIILTRI